MVAYSLIRIPFMYHAIQDTTILYCMIHTLSNPFLYYNIAKNTNNGTSLSTMTRSSAHAMAKVII